MYKKREIIHKVTSELRANKSLSIALENTELKSKMTFYNWMYKNPRLMKLIRKLEERCDGVRVDMVEDALFNKLISGKAHPAEYIFFLCNRGNGRWKNDYRIEHSGRIEGTDKVIVNIINTKQEANASDSRIKSNSTIPT